MKKIFALLLVLAFMLSLVACGSDASDDKSAGNAKVCHECGNPLDDNDEGWMSSVYDENSNMIDVYICDDCWE